MPWKCRLVASRDTFNVGDMYFSEKYDSGRTAEFCHPLSPEYKRDWPGKRAPIFIVTPGGPWCIDGQSTDGNGNFTGRGWTVTGEVPNLTATPSINMPGVYHGWLTNGILSDDIEGRTY